MTYLDLLRPAHMTHERLALRATIIRIARNPAVERAVAAVILFAVGFGCACQFGVAS